MSNEEYFLEKKCFTCNSKFFAKDQVQDEVEKEKLSFCRLFGILKTSELEVINFTLDQNSVFCSLCSIKNKKIGVVYEEFDRILDKIQEFREDICSTLSSSTDKKEENQIKRLILDKWTVVEKDDPGQSQTTSTPPTPDAIVIVQDNTNPNSTTNHNHNDHNYHNQINNVFAEQQSSPNINEIDEIQVQNNDDAIGIDIDQDQRQNQSQDLDLDDQNLYEGEGLISLVPLSKLIDTDRSPFGGDSQSQLSQSSRSISNTSIMQNPPTTNPAPSNSNPLDNDEILKRIFMNLGLKDILNCRFVSKRWSQLSNTQLDKRGYTTVNLNNISEASFQNIIKNSTNESITYTRFHTTKEVLVQALFFNELTYPEYVDVLRGMKYLEIRNLYFDRKLYEENMIYHAIVKLDQSKFKFEIVNLEELKLYGSDEYEIVNVQEPDNEFEITSTVAHQSENGSKLPNLKRIKLMPSIKCPNSCLKQFEDFIKELINISPSVEEIQFPRGSGSNLNILDHLQLQQQGTLHLNKLVFVYLNAEILKKLVHISQSTNMKLKSLTIYFEQIHPRRISEMDRKFYEGYLIDLLECHKDTLEELKIYKSHWCTRTNDKCWSMEQSAQFIQNSVVDTLSENTVLRKLTTLILPLDSALGKIQMNKLGQNFPVLEHLTLFQYQYSTYWNNLENIEPNSFQFEQNPTCSKSLWNLHRKLWKDLGSITEPILTLKTLNIMNPIPSSKSLLDLARIFPNLQKTSLCIFSEDRYYSPNFMTDVWKSWANSLRELTIFAIDLMDIHILKPFPAKQQNDVYSRLKYLTELNFFGKVQLDGNDHENFSQMRGLRNIRVTGKIFERIVLNEEEQEIIWPCIEANFVTEIENYIYWLEENFPGFRR